MQLPKFINRIIKEKNIIEKISLEENIDIIISDNRFGLRSKSATNIFITHQLNIMGPLLVTKLINYNVLLSNLLNLHCLICFLLLRI